VWSLNDLSNSVRCLAMDDWELLDEGGPGTHTGKKSAILKNPFYLHQGKSEEQFIIGSGDIQGSVQIVEDPTLVDRTRVDMRVDYYEAGSDALSNLNICNLVIKGMSTGINIVVSFVFPAVTFRLKKKKAGTSKRPLETLHFVITVSLPVTNGSVPKGTSDFVVRLPRFNVDIDFLDSQHVFGTFSADLLDGEFKAKVRSKCDLTSNFN
jgi:hypothetical protein